MTAQQWTVKHLAGGKNTEMSSNSFLTEDVMEPLGLVIKHLFICETKKICS